MTTITNFGVVVPGKLYRGAQPTDEQFVELKALGVKVVLDFREPWGRADEKKACQSLGIAHVNIPIGDMVLYAAVGMTPPTEAELDRIAPYLLNAASAPVFGHCQHGRDRTGGVMAWYRMKHQGWTNAAALEEALKYGIQEKPIIGWIGDYKC